MRVALLLALAACAAPLVSMVVVMMELCRMPEERDLLFGARHSTAKQLPSLLGSVQPSVQRLEDAVYMLENRLG